MDGLVFTCRIGTLPQTTFQVAQFTLQEELSQLYRLTLKVVSSRDDIPLNEQLGRRKSATAFTGSNPQAEANLIPCQR